ncbi:MAG: hypothetical protein WCI73_14920, partial [Phycisphaerae bacterium]
MRLRFLPFLTISLCLLLRQSALAQPHLPEFDPASTTQPTSQPTSRPLPAVAPADSMPSVSPNPVPLHISLAQCDHPSGIYYAREPARCTLLIENPNAAPTIFQGQIAFGPAPADGQAFKPLTITPLTETTIAPRQRAKIEVTGTVGPPGRYEFRWNNQPVDVVGGQTGELEVRCIFPPRDRAAETLPAEDQKAAAAEGGAAKVAKPPAPWVMRLPRAAALVPGYLADFSARTSISRFILEDPWPIPTSSANGPAVFGGPLALNGTELQTLLAQVRAAQVRLTIRLALTPEALTEPAQLTALHAHITALLQAAGKSVEGIVVTLPAASPPAGQVSLREAAIAHYLAVYDAAKKHDRNIVMLGLGSVTHTGNIIFRHDAASPDLTPYVDALAITQRFGELWQLNQAIAPPNLSDRKFAPVWPKKPIWILPHPPHEKAAAGAGEVFESPALALAQSSLAGLVGGLKAVPVPDFDRGVTVHLFGQSVFYQRLRPDLPPFLAAFQGNG